MFVNRGSPSPFPAPHPRGSSPTAERRGIRTPLSIISSAAAGALATTRTDNSVEGSRRRPTSHPFNPSPPSLNSPNPPEARRPSLRAFYLDGRRTQKRSTGSDNWISRPEINWLFWQNTTLEKYSFVVEGWKRRTRRMLEEEEEEEVDVKRDGGGGVAEGGEA